ncbi:hypothetical protein [Pollutibacter soli]|uniref:hypothetical protein n=1 Tax=Pollutibacter soli TaxID=3034157 RepID=UPI003013FF3C
MKAFIIFGKCLLFIVLTTVNVEFLINRSSSTFLTLLAIAVEMFLIYILIVPLIRKLIRS